MACRASHPAPEQFTIQTLTDWSEVDQLLAVEQETEPSWMDDPDVVRYLAYGELPTELLRAKLYAEMKAERTHTEER